ncbi:MAG: right-handed parallel beta-helix repeat-containing protein [Planctomycetota bacterium]
MCTRLLLLALLLPAQGCVFAAGGVLLDSITKPDPPRVSTSWANGARAVTSPDTPSEDDDLDPIASYDDDGERDTNELDDLDGQEGLGDVVVDMGEGIYLLEGPIRLKKPRSLVLRGKGANKTRLQLECDLDEHGALVIAGAGRVRIEGVTLVSLHGDGLTIRDCPQVEVDGAHFAGSYHGLRLEGCKARVSDSVFAGCQRGIAAKKSEVSVYGSAFSECWNAVWGQGSVFTLEASVFLENRGVCAATVDARSSLKGCLVFGQKQSMGWKGQPGLAAGNLVHFRHLGTEVGPETNIELTAPDDFPDQVTWPRDLDVVAVHLAKFRLAHRGEADPPGQLADLRRQRSEQLARACQEALKKQDLDPARALARLALRYWGDRDVAEAPQALKEIMALAK